MAIDSSIEWTDATWNPVAGCTPVSPGCLNCYAARMALRLERMGGDTAEKYQGTATRARNGRPVFAGRINLDHDALNVPRHWKRGRRIFVNSMSDLFHEGVPLGFIRKVFKVMGDCPQHEFQILTKRPERAIDLAPKLDWHPNVWMGTSVESALYTHRAETLRQIPAAVRFLSVEPLIGRIPKLPLAGIHWVIVGGESGPGARPMEESWVTEIKEHCEREGVPFFFKQWGGVQKSRTGRLLEGRTWNEMPSCSAM